MSPILEIITDIVAQAVGDVVWRKQKRRPFPEGEMNASLGAVAAFAGALAFIFALAVLLNAAYTSDFTAKDYASLIGASIAVATYGGSTWTLAAVELGRVFTQPRP